MDCQLSRFADRRFFLAKVLALLLGAVCLLVSGCDDRPAPPTPLPDPPPAHLTIVPATSPTTQELTMGKRKTLQLGVFPLTLDVPESWKITSTPPSSVWVEGFSPSGEIRLLLSPTGETLKPLLVKVWETRIQKENDKPLPNTLYSILKPIGGAAEAFDHREVSTTNPRKVEWTVSALVPMGDDFTLDLVQFIGLTRTQYDQDHEFLEKIMSTLHYDGVPSGLP